MADQSLLATRQARIRERANELVKAGADRLQASYQALEEAWRDEAAENARLWDQADEVVRLREALEQIYKSGAGPHVEIAREALNA